MNANLQGWAGDGKFLYLDPSEVRAAYASAKRKNRGFAFWNIKDEGLTPRGNTAPCRMAAGLNSFLNIRS